MKQSIAHTSLRCLLAGMALLIANACGSDSAEPSDPLDAAVLLQVTPGAPVVTDCMNAVLHAAVLDADDAPIDGATFTWSTLDPAIATVTSAGIVTGQGPGAVTIVASFRDLADSVTVTVNEGAYHALHFTPDTLTIASGASSALTGGVLDCRGEAGPAAAVTFTSLDGDVASVGTDGLITAAAAGIARIVASNGAAADTAWVRVSGAYAFVLDTTITGGGRYYTVDVGAAGFAYLTRPSHAKLARLDLLTRSVALNAAAVGAEANGVTLAPGGGVAFSANQDAQTVSRVATATSAVLGAFPVNGAPFRVAASSDGAQLAVSSSLDSLQIFTATGIWVRDVKVRSEPYGMARRPNGELIVGHLGSPIVMRIDSAMTTATIFDSLPSTTNNVAISPDGAKVFVTSDAAGKLYIRNAANGAFIADVPISGAWGVAVTPDGTQVWVTTLDGNVVAVSTTSNTVVGTVFVGGAPRGIAIHPLGWGAVVANENGSINILR